jgi:putative membrane protein
MMNHMKILEHANQRQAAASKETPTGSEAQKAKEQGAGNAGGEDSTVKIAQTVSRKLFDHDLSDREKQIAGPAVHYAYGMVVGGIYGGLAEVWPNVKTGFGMAYGIAVWAIGDEAAMPALRLSPPPTRIALDKHADTLSAHVCYGLTLDFVRRIAKVII